MTLQYQSLLLGIITILCWSSLAALGSLLNHLPPFYLVGVSFLIGSLPGWTRPKQLFPNWRTVCWGVLGYFGYHFFLFYSFRFAPAIEANLINYMWPVFMVLFSPLFFPASKLTWYHISGASLAVIGCVLLVLGDGGEELKLENLKGYALALGAALTWPIFSLGSKKLPKTSSMSVSGFCLGAGILSLMTHMMIEPHVVLQSHDAWKIFLMGIGPFGLAFYCWDLALQKGDTCVLGALSYLTPVLSTLGLIYFADQKLTNSTGLAMLLIIGGASSGLLDFLPSKTLNKSV